MRLAFAAVVAIGCAHGPSPTEAPACTEARWPAAGAEVYQLAPHGDDLVALVDRQRIVRYDLRDPRAAPVQIAGHPPATGDLDTAPNIYQFAIAGDDVVYPAIEDRHLVRAPIHTVAAPRPFGGVIEAPLYVAALAAGGGFAVLGKAGWFRVAADGRTEHVGAEVTGGAHPRSLVAFGGRAYAVNGDRIESLGATGDPETAWTHPRGTVMPFLYAGARDLYFVALPDEPVGESDYDGTGETLWHLDVATRQATQLVTLPHRATALASTARAAVTLVIADHLVELRDGKLAEPTAPAQALASIGGALYIGGADGIHRVCTP